MNCKKIPLPAYRSTFNTDNIYCKKCFDLENFDFKKYLAEGILLKENTQHTELKPLENVVQKSFNLVSKFANFLQQQFS